MNVLIVGAGAWGTTLAALVDRAGHSANLIARNAHVAFTLRATRRHPVSLPGFELPLGVNVTGDWSEALIANPAVIVIAGPIEGIGEVARKLEDASLDGIIATATKGIDPKSLRTDSERILSHTVDPEQFVAISGPNLASEIAQGLPAAAVVASASSVTATRVQRCLMSPTFRIYSSSDVIGVELADALKNVIAIGAGISDGMHAGQNAKAAFITRGIAEMTRLGVVCGADPMTFAGLAGIGDLIATCGSTLSRNHTVGRRLAEGEPLDQILDTMFEVAEGVPTTRAAIALGERHGVELPICVAIGDVLFNGVRPQDAVDHLMSREATAETR